MVQFGGMPALSASDSGVAALFGIKSAQKINVLSSEPSKGASSVLLAASVAVA